jgi:hypothetical protein
MRSIICASIAAVLVMLAMPSAGRAQEGKSLSSQRLQERTVHRRAVEAAIWGMPFVSVDAMRQAYFRNAGAKYNDIIYFAKPADWKFPVHHAERFDPLCLF